MSASVLQLVQDAAVAQVAAQPFFSGSEDSKPVPVIGEAKRDILTEVQTRVAKLGVCAIVAVGQAPVTYPDIPGPRYQALDLRVLCYERVTINRGATGTGKTALQVAEAAAAALHLVTLPVEGTSVLRVAAIEPTDADESSIAYAVRLTLDAGGGEPTDRVIPQVTWPEDPPPSGGDYAKIEDGRLKLLNLSTGRWHGVYVTGGSGAERLAVDAGEDAP